MRRIAIVASLLVTTVAHGQPSTPSLDATRVEKKLPIRHWKFEIAIDDLQGWVVAKDDVGPDRLVVMARPSGDMILFAAGAATPSCATMLERSDGTYATERRMTASSLGLDATFYATVRQAAPINGRDALVGCLEAGGRTLVFQWMVSPASDAARRASGVRVINAVGAGWREVATGAPQRLALPDGNEIRVADRSVLWHVSGSTLMRVDDESTLAAAVAGGTATCDEEVRAWRALRWQIVTAPSYLTPGWSPEVAIGATTDTQVLFMCLPRKDGGSIELQWIHAKPDASDFARVIRPVLEAFAATYGVPPPPPPSPPPATIETALASSYTPSSVTRTDTSAEPARAMQRLSTLSLAVHNLSSEPAGIDDSYGIAIGYESVLSRGGVFGLRLRATAGYDTQSKAMFDGSIGLGLRSRYASVHAVVGADGIGLGQEAMPDRIKLDTDVYYGADAMLGVDDIDLGFGYYARSADVASSEYRIEIGYRWYSDDYKRRRLAFRYTHYEDVANIASLAYAW